MGELQSLGNGAGEVGMSIHSLEGEELGLQVQ